MWSPSTKPAMVSNIGMSTRWPFPVRSRCTRLAQIAPTAVRPTMRSTSAFGRQRGRALDQVVIGGFCGIRPVLAEAEHAGIDQARIDLGEHVVAELQSRHRLRAHIVDQ